MLSQNENVYTTCMDLISSMNNHELLRQTTKINNNRINSDEYQGIDLNRIYSEEDVPVQEDN